MEVLPCLHPGPSTPGNRHLYKSKFRTTISQVGDSLPCCLDGPPRSQPTRCHHHLCRRTHNCPGKFLSSPVEKTIEANFDMTGGVPGQRLGPARLPSLVPWPQPRTYLGKGTCFHLLDSSLFSLNICQCFPNCISLFRVLSYPSYLPSAYQWL